MKANASQIRSGLDRPDDHIRLYLLFGPDSAGAAELAQRLARAMGDGAERVDLDGATLKSRPALLAEEAASLSLFGDARHIRVTGAGDESLAAVELLLAAERAGNPVVMIAPGLKTTSKLVKLAIATPAALSYGCYIPEGEEAARIAANLAREAGLRLQPAAARELAVAAAGDRAIMAREIEKLALYLDAGLEQPRDADLSDLEAIGADLGDAQGTKLANAILNGEMSGAVDELATYEAEGGSMIALLRTLQRRMLQLAELRAKVDAGQPPREVVERSNIFAREKPAMVRALERWPSHRIAQALDRLVETERALKRSANAGEVLGAAMIAGLARAAGGRQR